MSNAVVITIRRISLASWSLSRRSDESADEDEVRLTTINDAIPARNTNSVKKRDFCFPSYSSSQYHLKYAELRLNPKIATRIWAVVSSMASFPNSPTGRTLV